jgi:guanylate kinase
MPERKNLIIIISAPSGSGKTTIVDRLQKKIISLSRKRSSRRRSPAESSLNGKKSSGTITALPKNSCRKRLKGTRT